MRYIVRRVGFYVIALWASITINFFIPRLIPGDPVAAMLAHSSTVQITKAQLEAFRVMLGVPNTPIWVQYFQYLQNFLSGNLGISLSNYPHPVTELLAQELPWTLGLVGLASII